MSNNFFYIILIIALFGVSCNKDDAEIEENINTIIIPVNIKKFNFDYATDLSSTLSEIELNNYLINANEIWSQANIEFVINSIDTVLINDTTFQTNDYSTYTNPSFRKELESFSENYTSTKSMSEQGVWTIVLISKFPHPAGGVWSNKTQIVFFAESNNGSSTVSNILAHELGHSLSLTHVNANQFPDNLMKSGDGEPEKAKLLSSDQVNSARQAALSFLK